MKEKRRAEVRKRQAEEANEETVSEDIAANATPTEEIVHEVVEETIESEEPFKEATENSAENVEVIGTEPSNNSDETSGNEVAAATAAPATASPVVLPEPEVTIHATAILEDSPYDTLVNDDAESLVRLLRVKNICLETLLVLSNHLSSREL